jgi:hypothetical protein
MSQIPESKATTTAVAIPVSTSMKMACPQPPYDITCKLTVQESLGSVVVAWDLPSPYAFAGRGEDGSRPQDGVILQLLGNGVIKANQRTVDRQGTWSTGQAWGSGWSALLLAFDRSSNNWIPQIETPRTTE